MTQLTRESLSALLDDEAGDLDVQRILNDMGEDNDTAATWRRYHLAAASMRNELNAFSQVDLSARIRDTIEQQPQTAQQGSRFGSWVKPFASVAVAASVTAVILTSTQLFNAVSGTGTPAQPAALAVSGSVSPMVAGAQSVGFGTAPTTVAPVAPARQMAPIPGGQSMADEMARQRLEFYLRNHAENAALNTSSGMLPLARTSIVEDH